MQASLSLFDPDRTFADIHRRLGQVLAPADRDEPRDPLGELVFQLLRKRSEPAVASLAYVAIRQTYQTWRAFGDADIEALEVLAEPADRQALRDGLAAIRAISSHAGRPRLDFLLNVPVMHALSWLEKLPGVDRSVAGFVLGASSMARPVLLIDAAYLRPAVRLGLVEPGTPLRAAHDILDNLRPHLWSASDFQAHYARMIQLGDRFCREDKPRCRTCPVRGVCATRPSQPA